MEWARGGRACADALAATALLGVAVVAGSRAGRDLDPALYGYLAATVVATFAVTWRVSAFWRRRPSAFYGRALVRALRRPRDLRLALRSAARDVGAQRFIAARGRGRWLAHLALSLGTLTSFVITLPLVFGCMRFAAVGQTRYRPIVAGIALPSFPLDGIVALLFFHALALAAVAVALGALYFLAVRLRARAAGSAHVAPLVLLLAVALSGLALPATRAHAALFRIAALAHEAAVVLMLVALPFSKLGHVLIRPLQIGARIVRGASEERLACDGCGASLAPTAQLAAVEALLAERGVRDAATLRRCPPCRRRDTAAAQARLVGAGFHPDLVDARVSARATAHAARALGRAA
jgi:hypothetical protein